MNYSIIYYGFYVPMWLCGYVAMWLCGYVAKQSAYPSTYRLPPLHQTTLLGDTRELGDTNLRDTFGYLFIKQRVRALMGPQGLGFPWQFKEVLNNQFRKTRRDPDKPAFSTFLRLLSCFYGNFMERICSKAPQYHSASI